MEAGRAGAAGVVGRQALRTRSSAARGDADLTGSARDVAAGGRRAIRPTVVREAGIVRPGGSAADARVSRCVLDRDDGASSAGAENAERERDDDP